MHWLEDTRLEGVWEEEHIVPLTVTRHSSHFKVMGRQYTKYMIWEKITISSNHLILYTVDVLGQQYSFEGHPSIYAFMGNQNGKGSIIKCICSRKT